MRTDFSAARNRDIVFVALLCHLVVIEFTFGAKLRSFRFGAISFSFASMM